MSGHQEPAGRSRTPQCAYSDERAVRRLRELLNGLEHLQCRIANFGSAAGCVGAMLDQPGSPTQDDVPLFYAAENIFASLGRDASELVAEAMRLTQWAKLRHGQPDNEAAA